MSGKRYIESYANLSAFPLGERDGTMAWSEEEKVMYFIGDGVWQPFTSGTSVFNTMTYDYDKTVDVLGIPETYVPVGQLITPLRAAGTYVLGFSLTWTFDRTTESVFLRWRQKISGIARYVRISILMLKMSYPPVLAVVL